MDNSKKFELLVKSNTRQEDKWVNATQWCVAFGQKWRNFSKSNGVRRYAKSLQDKALNGVNPIKSEGKGKNAQTWIHPLLAIKLAEWLSPEFELYVKQTFKRYIEKDITLAPTHYKP